MKYLGLILLLLVPSVAQAKPMSGGAPSPVVACTASPPSPASLVGITTLIMCDSFTDNTKVDVNNTQAAGFDWYPASAGTFYAITPAANITTDGTGMQILGSGGTFGDNSSGKTMQTLGRSASGPHYVGASVSGSYYAEIDMKFNPVTPVNQQAGNSPAFWDQEYTHYLAQSGYPVTPPSTYVELDIGEYVPTGVGTGYMNSQFHRWSWNGGTPTLTCSNTNTNQPSLTYSNYNTYAIMVLTAADNGGTGLVKWYINNSLVNSCSYTQSGAVSCTGGGTSSCGAGTLYELDTQSTVIMLGAGYPPWGETVRNFHVWHK